MLTFAVLRRIPKLLLWFVAIPAILLDSPPGFSQTPAGSGCLKLPSGASEQEQWTWDRICAGQNANLQLQYGGTDNPKDAQNWPTQRDLSRRFLVTILLNDSYRNSIPPRGIVILGAHFPETIDLSYAKLGRDLWLRQSRFEGDNADSLPMLKTEASGHLDFDGSVFTKGVNMGGLHADSLYLTNGSFVSVWLADAKFNLLRINDTTVSKSLEMSNLEVATDFEMLMSTLVDVHLRSAKVGGHLEMEGPRNIKGSVCPNQERKAPRPTYPSQSVDLSGATVGTLSFGSSCYGPFDAPNNWGSGATLILANASVDTLQDGLCANEESDCPVWPEHVELAGFKYLRLESSDADKILDMAPRSVTWWTGWLGRQRGRSAQPYEFLAARFMELGDKEKAEDILYAEKNQELKNTPFPGNTKLWLERLFIGYGYRTQYSLIWAAGFVLLGASLLRLSREGPRNKMPYGFAFSFDMLIPLVRLREYHYKVDLKGWIRYYFYFHKLMGFVLASFLVAGLSGLTK